MTSVTPGRIPMSEAEEGHLNTLLETLGDDAVHATFSRRDPGESGPVLVQTQKGASYVVSDDGAEEV